MPIRKTKKGYKIENVKAIYETREEATKALRAIKANQARKRAGKKAKAKTRRRR